MHPRGHVLRYLDNCSWCVIKPSYRLLCPRPASQRAANCGQRARAVLSGARGARACCACCACCARSLLVCLDLLGLVWSSVRRATDVAFGHARGGRQQIGTTKGELAAPLCASLLVSVLCALRPSLTRFLRHRHWRYALSRRSDVDREPDSFRNSVCLL